MYLNILALSTIVFIHVAHGRIRVIMLATPDLYSIIYLIQKLHVHINYSDKNLYGIRKRERIRRAQQNVTIDTRPKQWCPEMKIHYNQV